MCLNNKMHGCVWINIGIFFIPGRQRNKLHLQQFRNRVKWRQKKKKIESIKEAHEMIFHIHFEIKENSNKKKKKGRYRSIIYCYTLQESKEIHYSNWPRFLSLSLLHCFHKIQRVIATNVNPKKKKKKKNTSGY